MLRLFFFHVFILGGVAAFAQPLEYTNASMDLPHWQQAIELGPDSAEETQFSTSKHWLTISGGAMEMQEAVTGGGGYYSPSFILNGRIGLLFEVDDKVNWKLGFNHYEIRAVNGYEGVIESLVGATDIGTVTELEGAIGKTVIQTKGGGFKIKPWIGGGVNLHPVSQFADEDRSVHSESASHMVSGVEFNDTTTIYMKRDFGFFARGGLELEFRVLKRFKFSLFPMYTLGALKLYESEISYEVVGEDPAEARLWTRGSHWGALAQIKIPLGIGE